MPDKYPTKEQHGFSRLETDEEFRKRLAVHASALVVEYDELVTNVYYNFSHTERRRKFVRIAELAGEALDEAAWATLTMQRKIIRP